MTPESWVLNPGSWLLKPGDLALIQLQLDAAVAPVGLGAVAFLERAELGEASGCEAFGRHAARLQIPHHIDRALGRELPVRREFEGADRILVGVAVDAQHPVELRRDVLGD